MACSIVLNEDSFTIHTADGERDIHYSSIKVVTLSKSNESDYRMSVTGTDLKKIDIGNKYFLPTGNHEDRSRQYTNFVKLFHSQLMKKATPVFLSGNSFELLIPGILISAFVSLFTSFILEFVGKNFIHPFIQMMGLMILTSMCILIFSRYRRDTYKPDRIPNQFLPDA